jgi:3-oxoacyl-[acyl-carrier protein] reductase
LDIGLQADHYDHLRRTTMAWSDQVAVVTGGSRGIGRATALLLAQRGAAVCVNYVARPDAADAVVGEISAAGGRAIAVAADVADSAAATALIERAEQMGPVTIVVNNAGLSGAATLDTYDSERFDRMRRVNVDGIINITRAVMKGMRDRGYGRIINLASIAAIGTALPGNAFYAATKAEAVILTRRFAMELGPHGITVNAVAPGFVRTDMTQGRLGAGEWDVKARQLAERAMTGRIGEPEDIANAVAFLAAPESGWITAQVLVVDGGRMDYIGHG